MNTIEEKAIAYTESTDTRVFGSEETLDATELIQKGYIAGAKEALAGQWRRVEDELPKDQRDVFVRFVNYAGGVEYDCAYYDGEDWYTNGGDHIRPAYWMTIPELPKTDKK